MRCFYGISECANELVCPLLSVSCVIYLVLSIVFVYFVLLLFVCFSFSISIFYLIPRSLFALL